jgi:hypothetical protein
MENSLNNPGKKLIILKDFFFNMGMTVNTKKTKVLIIKYKMITYDSFFMTRISWRKFLHTNILELISTTSSIRTIVVTKGYMEG